VLKQHRSAFILIASTSGISMCRSHVAFACH
jgi:hypothetical protein